MIKTQQLHKSLANNKFGGRSFPEKIKTQNRPVREALKGPVKASYDIPEEQWQVRYQYRSPQKVQNGRRVPPFPEGGGGRKGERRRGIEESSDYGTMSRGDMEEPQLTDGLAELDICQDDETVFNEVTIEERRERIDSVLDEIFSVPKLADANLTQRNLSNPKQMKKFLGGSGGISNCGSVANSRISRTQSSRLSQQSTTIKQQKSNGLDQRYEKEGQGYNRSSQNSSRQFSQRLPLRRTVSSPKLELIPETRKRPTVGQRTRKEVLGIKPPLTKPSIVPKLNLNMTNSFSSSVDAVSVKQRSKRDEELSAQYLPSRDMEVVPQFGNDTEAELAICVPMLGEDTEDSFQCTADDSQPLRDFMAENMKVSRKEFTGRTSGASSQMSQRHKAGTVPRYLKTRQNEWREAEEQRIANIPDPDCPPGHRLLGDEERTDRISSLENEQASLLRDLSNLPVSSDTRRVRLKRQEIEEGLTHLEERLRSLSRAKVFVMDDS